MEDAFAFRLIGGLAGKTITDPVKMYWDGTPEVSKEVEAIYN